MTDQYHRSRFFYLSWKVFFFAWAGVILCVTILPLSNFQGHSHWDGVHWIPFIDLHLSVSWLVNFVANILLFLPFGFLYFQGRVATGASPTFLSLEILILSFLFSLTVEFYQIYCHNRHPSMTDVLSNTTGASVGGWVGRKVRGRAGNNIPPFGISLRPFK